MKKEILPNAVYTTKEAAELLDLSLVTIQKYVREGKIAARRIGDKWYRITGQALLDFMNTKV
jgi:excisionase family DNA binding protein